MIHENYTSRERKKDRLRLKVRRDELRETLAAHRVEYRRHVQDAADEDGIERRLNVERARLAGKEYEVTRRQYRRNGILIATHLIIEFAAEVEKTLEGTQHPNHLFTVPLTSHTVQVYDIYEECAQLGVEKPVLRRVIDELLFDDIDAEILTSLLEELEKGLDPESPQEVPNGLLMEYDESGHGEIRLRSDRDDDVDLPDIDDECDLPGVDGPESESPGTAAASGEPSNDRHETDDEPLAGLRAIDEAVSVDADLDVGHPDGWADAEIDVDVNSVVSDLLAGEDPDADSA